MLPRHWPPGWRVLPPGIPRESLLGKLAILLGLRKRSAPAKDHTRLLNAQPGDLILYCPDTPNLKQRLILAGQRLAFTREHACFTHIALVVDEGRIIDSVSNGGVAERDLSTLSKDGWLRVRRPKDITPAQREAVCRLARNTADEKRPYNGLRALVDGLRLDVNRKPWKTMLANPNLEDAFYCGELVDAIYLAERGDTVVDGAKAPLPAAFSASELFEDVKAEYAPGPPPAPGP